MMEKVFGVYNCTTGEILADNLLFEDMPELLEAYQDFYPDHKIVAYYQDIDYEIMQNETITDNAINSRKNKFKTEWYLLVEENLVNFY